RDSHHVRSARTPLVSGPEEPEGTVPGRTSTPPTAPRRPCFSHVSIITVGRRPFLSPRVLNLRHPCLFDESCDLFPTSEHHFGVKQHLMRGDRGDTEEAGLAVSDELAPARLKLRAASSSALGQASS
ncbi:putative riboflavin kinase, partial [Dissostichus eleginoides]